MKLFVTILSILIFGGCNPAKKVLKNKQQFDAIGREWALQNPCANDTVTRIIHGDTVKVVTEKTDTIYNSLPDVYIADTVFKITERIVIKWRTENNTIHDTISNTVIDKRQVDAAEKKATAAEIEKIKEQKKASTRLWMLIASGLINLLLLVLLTRKK